MSMLKKITALLFIIILMLSSCKSNSVDGENLYNEAYNKVAECNDSIYYIKDDNLLCDIDTPYIIDNNVCAVQEYNNEIYYTKKDNEKNQLKKYDGKNQCVLELPDGDLDKLVIYDETVYFTIDNELFYNNLDEKNHYLIKPKIMDFIVNNNTIYCIEVNVEYTEDSSVDIKNLPDIKRSNKLIAINIINRSEKLIAENEWGFFIAPAKTGIAYYDRDETMLRLYKNNSEINLSKNWIMGIISYNDYILYTSLNSNGVYMKAVNSNDEIKILEQIKIINGVMDGYLFTSEEEWIKCDDIKGI